MTDLTDFARLVTLDNGLCVVSTLRGDGTIQSSVVNAGVLDHPLTGRPVVGLVARGGSRKLANLRARPQATIVVRAGWQWAAAEGPARSEEHTSELQSHHDLVCRLLLEKK